MRRLGFRQTATVVFDDEINLASAFLQTYPDILWVAVHAGVARGFLRNSVQVRGGFIVCDQYRLVAVELATHLEVSRDGVRQIHQCRHQAFGFGLDRMQAARQRPRLLQRFVDIDADLVRVAGFGAPGQGELIIQRFNFKSDSDKPLTEVIMQIVADAALFAFTDLEDLLFELPPMLHLVAQRLVAGGECERAFGHASFQFFVEPLQRLLSLFAGGDIA